MVHVHEFAAAILSNLGHEVTKAGTLEDGRAAWVPQRYDLVIVDLKRNLAEAMEFCEELKQRWPEQLVAFLPRTTLTLLPTPARTTSSSAKKGPASSWLTSRTDSPGLATWVSTRLIPPERRDIMRPQAQHGKFLRAGTDVPPLCQCSPLSLWLS